MCTFGPLLCFAQHAVAIDLVAVLMRAIIYFEKIRVFKAGELRPLNSSAWDNGIGLSSYCVGFRDEGND